MARQPNFASYGDEPVGEGSPTLLRLNLFQFYGHLLLAQEVCVSFRERDRGRVMEDRILTSIRQLSGTRHEGTADSPRVYISDPLVFQAALWIAERVLKGWQERAELGGDYRRWSWILEGSTDAGGIDHTGGPACLRAYIRLTEESGGVCEPQKVEDDDFTALAVEFLTNHTSPC